MGKTKKTSSDESISKRAKHTHNTKNSMTNIVNANQSTEQTTGLPTVIEKTRSLTGVATTEKNDTEPPYSDFQITPTLGRNRATVQE